MRNDARIAFAKKGSVLCAFLSATLCAAVAAEPNNDTPKEVLLRSLERKVACTLVQSQRMDSKRFAVQVKVQMDSEGRSRRTVLQPLSMQGTVSIDDGHSWFTLFPDEKKLVIQPSPSEHRQNPRTRILLIEQNYRLSFERGTNIAGRKAFVVTAAPKAKELPLRRYAIDGEKFVLLRLERIDSEGKTRIELDTQAITYGKPPEDLFEMPQVEGVRVERCWGPRRITDLSKARELIGFEPRPPDHLPYGFVMSDADLLGSTESAFIALRLSDGLAHVTVYQWDGKRGHREVPFRPPGDGQDGDGICYVVLGDIPRSVRKKILESFLHNP